MSEEIHVNGADGYSEEILVAAHRRSIKHRAEIEGSSTCGCFFCGAVLEPSAITHWVDDGQTALCPFCGIDSVLGAASGYPVSDETFLRAMHVRWFS